jgi:simple sugar transport system substrate-binding protein/ribose transport system substrate-binding protein
MLLRPIVAVMALAIASSSSAFKLAIVAFQMSAETHARCSNSRRRKAKKLGWTVQQLNSEGSLPKHAEQMEAMIQAKVDGLVLCMGKPIEAEAQFAAVKKAGIPLVTVVSGTSPHSLFDIQVNDYVGGAQATMYLLSKMNYRGEILTARFEQNVASRIRGKELDVILSENNGGEGAWQANRCRAPRARRDDVRNGMQRLILQNKGKFQGVWASWDGQAWIIDGPCCARRASRRRRREW